VAARARHASKLPQTGVTTQLWQLLAASLLLLLLLQLMCCKLHSVLLTGQMVIQVG
jgi:LPXTG-motif cell wall-anchored protein